MKATINTSCHAKSPECAEIRKVNCQNLRTRGCCVYENVKIRFKSVILCQECLKEYPLSRLP